MQKFALKKADAIITDSNCSKNDIIKYVGISKDKVSVVYLAAGEEFKVLEKGPWEKEISKKYNLPEKFVLYVGDVTWNKNLPRLIEAVQKEYLPLVMVGKALTEEGFDKDNPWNRDLVKVHELISKDKKITRLGFISSEDLVKIYNLASVFIMPSLYEGFGLPILEAMSCGCPVVTTKEGSLEEVAGDAAYFVDGYSLESIREGIKKVFSNDKLRKELTAKGLGNVNKFSWEKTAKETLAVYLKAIEI
jgi:glycosyltransferase involved in cell wall biosynthesis